MQVLVQCRRDEVSELQLLNMLTIYGDSPLESSKGRLSGSSVGRVRVGRR
jgi:hypothetical protein